MSPSRINSGDRGGNVEGRPTVAVRIKLQGHLWDQEAVNGLEGLRTRDSYLGNNNPATRLTDPLGLETLGLESQPTPPDQQCPYRPKTPRPFLGRSESTTRYDPKPLADPDVSGVTEEVYGTSPVAEGNGAWKDGPTLQRRTSLFEEVPESTGRASSGPTEWQCEGRRSPPKEEEGQSRPPLEEGVAGAPAKPGGGNQSCPPLRKGVVGPETTLLVPSKEASLNGPSQEEGEASVPATPGRENPSRLPPGREVAEPDTLLAPIPEVEDPAGRSSLMEHEGAEVTQSPEEITQKDGGNQDLPSRNQRCPPIGKGVAGALTPLGEGNQRCPSQGEGVADTPASTTGPPSGFKLVNRVLGDLTGQVNNNLPAAGPSPPRPSYPGGSRWGPGYQGG
jgi:hypothetical protein